MPTFTKICHPSEIQLDTRWRDAANFASKDRLVDKKGKTITASYEGKRYKLISKKERDLGPCERLGRVFLGTLCVAITGGLALLSKWVIHLLTDTTLTIRFGVLIQGVDSQSNQIKDDAAVIDDNKEPFLPVLENTVPLLMHAGIGNTGTNCYLSSLLQIIAHFKPLREILLSSDQDAVLHEAIRAHVEQILSGGKDISTKQMIEFRNLLQARGLVDGEGHGGEALVVLEKLILHLDIADQFPRIFRRVVRTVDPEDLQYHLDKDINGQHKFEEVSPNVIEGKKPVISIGISKAVDEESAIAAIKGESVRQRMIPVSKNGAFIKTLRCQETTSFVIDEPPPFLLLYVRMHMDASDCAVLPKELVLDPNAPTYHLKAVQANITHKTFNVKHAVTYIIDEDGQIVLFDDRQKSIACDADLRCLPGQQLVYFYSQDTL